MNIPTVNSAAHTFMRDPIVVTPYQLCISKAFAQIMDYYEGHAIHRVRLFHIDTATLWFIAEHWDGQFWTVSCNMDEMFPSLEAAIAWLSDNGGAAEFAHAMARI